MTLAALDSADSRGGALQEHFPGGVSNGNAWYPVFNGLQDWLYIATGCRAITLELSETKSPPASLLKVRPPSPPPLTSLKHSQGPREFCYRALRAAGFSACGHQQATSAGPAPAMRN